MLDDALAYNTRLKDKWIDLGRGRLEELDTNGAELLQGLLPTIIAQVGDHICNQGINGSQNDNATDDNIQEDDRNANVGNGRNGCSYKEFVACKPKEFGIKGGAVAYIHWVEKIEIHRMVAATEPPTIQNAILKVRVLTDKAVRNVLLKRTGERRGYGGESSKEGNDQRGHKEGKPTLELEKIVFAHNTNPVRK
ncbi:hypothetical protein Tco_0459332 [Tanacetum coccineum]